MRRLLFFPGIVVSLILATPLGLHSAQADTSGCTSELCSLANTGRLEDLRWPDFSDYRTRVQRFYESTGYALAWVEHGEATPAAKATIEVFQEAESKGLNPEDYDGSRWADRMAALSAREGDKSKSGFVHMDETRFDLALTVCVMRYISDLHSGKANPGTWRNTFDLEMSDLASFVRDRLLHATNVTAVLDGIEPPYEGYRRTETVLQKYLAMSHQAASAKNEPGPLPLTAKPVDPGKVYDQQK